MFNRAIKTNASLHLSNQNWNQKSPLAHRTRGHGWWHMVMKSLVSQGSPQRRLSFCCCIPILDSSLSHREAYSAECHAGGLSTDGYQRPKKKKKKKKKDGVSLSIEAPDGALKKYHLYFSPEG